MAQNQLQATLSKPQEAIQEYLDGLLHDATTRAKEEPEQLIVERAVSEVPQVAQALANAEISLVEEVSTSNAQAELSQELYENGRPVWAQERFECLLFSVAGLKLAVPLVELGTIYPLTDELTPLFGQADWFLGLYKHESRSIRVLDTARWVMPERYCEDQKQGLKYVISLQGCDWALAVHDVAEAVLLEPEAVRWRTQRSKRPWLAGTVIKEMCALVDVGNLSQLILEEEAKNSVRTAN